MVDFCLIWLLVELPVDYKTNNTHKNFHHFIIIPASSSSICHREMPKHESRFKTTDKTSLNAYLIETLLLTVIVYLFSFGRFFSLMYKGFEW